MADETPDAPEPDAPEPDAPEPDVPEPDGTDATEAAPAAEAAEETVELDPEIEALFARFEAALGEGVVDHAD